ERFHDLSVGSNGNGCKLTKELRKFLLICAGVTFAIAVSPAQARENTQWLDQATLCNGLP
ncbi:Hypothetical predicted protein, partial [Marmota monax]